MKRILYLAGCLLILGTLISCESGNRERSIININENATTTTSGNTVIITKKSYEELLSRIDKLEEEIASIKAESASKDVDAHHAGAIIHALDNIEDGDGILLSLETNKENLAAIHVKVPKKEYLSYKFYILAGYEKDNVPIFTSIIKPHYDTSNNPENIDVDKEKYELYKLMPSKIKYDDTSVLLIIAIDSNGKEYSCFVASSRSMKDR